MKNIFSKKSLALLITALMVFSSIAVIASADTTELDVWNGEIATEYAGGDGTAEKPYLISTPEQLALMATGTNYLNAESKYYKLTADIYLNDTTKTNWKENSPKEWLKTKTDSNYFFNGNFDGAGHTIYGLYASGNFERMGLFPGVVGTVSFKNLVISDSYFCGTDTAGKYIGGLLGFIYKDTSTVTVENCYIDDSVIIIGEHSVAGFIGYGNCASVNFKNCASFASVTNRSTQYTRYGSFVGALAGGARKVNYDGCIGNLAYTTYIQYPTYTASYCAVEGSKDTGNTGAAPVKVALEDMKGEAAKTNMPGLAWDEVWYTTENGYPTLTDPEAPACEHTNKKDANVVEATYFTEGSKDIVCDDCEEPLEQGVVIPCDTANPVKFSTPVLNPETNELTVKWEYSDALATDIAKATNKAVKVILVFDEKEYDITLNTVGSLGETLTLQGVNAERFNAEFSVKLEFTVDSYDTATLNAAAKSAAVKVSDTLDSTNEKAEAYNKLIEEIGKVENAVVAGEGTGNADFTAGASKVDIANGKAEIKFVATKALIDELKGKADYNGTRTTKLVLTIGSKDYDVEVAKLMSSITVNISGLSFEQMYGDISVKLVVDYAGVIETVTTETVTFSFTEGVNASELEAAKALEALLG